jgi:hypothetical protein
LQCNAPYELSVSNRGCVTRIWYKDKSGPKNTEEF